MVGRSVEGKVRTQAIRLVLFRIPKLKVSARVLPEKGIFSGKYILPGPAGEGKAIQTLAVPHLDSVRHNY